MANVVFVARVRSQVQEIEDQLACKETHGDTVLVIAADDFTASKYAGWVHILDVLPNKRDALILDHSDTHQTLGFVTDIHYDELDDGRDAKARKREKKPSLPKECPKCTYMKPANAHECPACGFKPERRSDVEQVDGDLIEVTRSDRATKQRWYSMLLGISDMKAKREGWAAHTYRAKFGVWPRGLSEVRARPDEEVSNYVKSRAIAWAKAQEKARSAA